ncbi:MAG: molybdate ABC transporter substrate-binding protein [Vulcanimicrobiaceae bacterium]
MSINPLRVAGIGAIALLAATVPQPGAAAPTEIIALVASNAKVAFTEVIKEFEAKHKGVTIKPNYLGGTKIGSMVDAQDPADVVLVGNSIVEKESQLVGPITPVLRNKEVILVPKNNPANIKSIKDLANPGVKLAMGTPNSAVGKLASRVIQNAAAAYGFEFVKSTRENVKVSAEKGSEVVGAVGGAANAAIAFESDKDDSKYLVIPIDDKFNVVSTYSMAVTKNSKNSELAKELVELVAGPDGQAILKKHNYMAPK